MLIFSIIGTLIGAGFASGQEIYLFFYKYGLNGIWGLILCSTFIAIVIYKTFYIVYTKKIKNYKDFLIEVFESKKISTICNVIINAFLLITFYIMIAGFGTYFKQKFQINSIIGAFILAGISYFVLIKDIEGVKGVNAIIVPILIVIILIIGFFGLKSCYCRAEEICHMNFENRYGINWILQAVVYCSYNMILVIPVVINLGKDISNKKQIAVISCLSGTTILVVALSVFFILASMNADFSKIQMPVVYAIDNSYPKFSGIYGIVILFSIFSTAISIGISLLKNITKNKKGYPQLVAIMCISGVLFSTFGFSNLVKISFPIFGYLGMAQIIAILKR